MAFSTNETAMGSYKVTAPLGFQILHADAVRPVTVPILSGVTITQGDAVMNSGGYAVPATSSTRKNNLIGIAMHTVTGSATVTQITVDEAIRYGEEYIAIFSDSALAATDIDAAALLGGGADKPLQSGASYSTALFRTTRILDTTNKIGCVVLSDFAS